VPRELGIGFLTGHQSFYFVTTLLSIYIRVQIKPNLRILISAFKIPEASAVAGILIGWLQATRTQARPDCWECRRVGTIKTFFCTIPSGAKLLAAPRCRNKSLIVLFVALD
jgi:hypothetical protein